MAVKDFLSGLSYRGTNLAADGGPIDVRGGPYTSRNFPLAFAAALREATRNGYLSPLGLDRVFAGQADSLVQAQRAKRQQGLRALQRSGLNPAMAARLIEEDESELPLQLSAARSEAERGLQEREFSANAEMAKVLATAETSEKTALQREEEQRKMLRLLKKGQKLQKVGLGISALSALTGIPGFMTSLAAGFSKLGGLFGLGKGDAPTPEGSALPAGLDLPDFDMNASSASPFNFDWRTATGGDTSFLGMLRDASGATPVPNAGGPGLEFFDPKFVKPFINWSALGQ